MLFAPPIHFASLDLNPCDRFDYVIFVALNIFSLFPLRTLIAFVILPFAGLIHPVMYCVSGDLRICFQSRWQFNFGSSHLWELDDY